MVRGRVQGVGFRWFVEREAHILGIAGWVRNNADGSVEILAQGTHDQLSGCVRACAKAHAPPAWMRSKSPKPSRPAASVHFALKEHGKAGFNVSRFQSVKAKSPSFVFET